MSSTLAVVLHGLGPFEPLPGMGDMAPQGTADLTAVAVTALRDAGVDEVRVLIPGGGDDIALPTGADELGAGSTVAEVLAAAAVAAERGGHDRILLHRLDHALTPPLQIARVLTALADGAPVAVPALPVTDTVTTVAGGELGATIDRTDVRAVCSPWGFTADALRGALTAARSLSSSEEFGSMDEPHSPDELFRRAALTGAGRGVVSVVAGEPAGAGLGDELARVRLAVAPPPNLTRASAGVLRGIAEFRPDRDTSVPSPARDGTDDLAPAAVNAHPADPGTIRTPAGRAAAVVLAAGSGTRFGAPVNKAYLPLAGTTVLAHSLRRFAALPEVGPVILVIREQDDAAAREVIAQVGAPVEIVLGDATRQGSELAALRHLGRRIDDGSVDLVAIHDSARPLVDSGLCRAVLSAARRHGGAVPGVLRPELAVVTGDGTGLLPDLTGPLVAVQTPQAFTAHVVREACERARADGFEGTDTASVVAAHGGPRARWVPAPATNLKITFAQDLPLAEHLLRRGRKG